MKKLRFKRISEGFYEVLLNDKRIATLTKMPWTYSDCPWVIESYLGRRYVSRDGSDCFSFRVAKAEIRSEAEAF